MAANYEFILTSGFERDFRVLAKTRKKLNNEFNAFLETFNPEAGVVIPGLRGARKMRMRGSGKGKRGGYRVVYYWTFGQTVYLLTIYAKAVKEDLTPDEKAALVKLIAELQARERK